jgi:DNA polymerase elongation subunit (family B)
MIMRAKAYLEEKHGARVIYGDTDSIFCVFPEAGRGHGAIMGSISRAEEASRSFREQIKRPHDLEYDKTFWPFIMLSKKRYVGNMYEGSDLVFQQKSMGIVLKRRDNAPIVKKVYGGVIDCILNKRDVGLSCVYLRSELEKLLLGDCPLEDLVVSKSLRFEYKDPMRIAHKVLAERMGERDPGSKPQIGDRIPYVYCVFPMVRGKKTLLQGDRIEHPAYVRSMGLKPDYHFYITNQIMKPVLQIYALVVEDLVGYTRPTGYIELETSKYMKKELDAKKLMDKVAALRETCAREVLFESVLRKLECIGGGNTEIGFYFERVSWG